MTEPIDTISDRLLERARLGELTEEELADLVERLEKEEGSTERLDSLIEADADFLERHPAAEMAPIIREKLRRRAREQERSAASSGELMLAIGKMFQSNQTRAFAAVAVVVVIAVAATLVLDSGGGEEPTDTLTPPVAGLDSPGEDEAIAPIPEEELAEEEDDEVATFVPFLERIDRGTTSTGEVVLEPGEEITFDSRYIRRIEVDQTAIASVPTVSEELGTITIRADEPGLTGIRIFFVEPHEPTTIYFRVARPYADDETFPDGEAARVPADEIEACEAEARRRGDVAGMIDLRFLNASRGEVTSVHAEYSTLDSEFTECLVEAGRQYEFPPTDERGMKTAVISLSFENSDPGAD